MNRRDFLHTLSAGAAGAALGQPRRATAQPSRRPNVILIYTDDQGSIDAGVYGARDIETPNIDRLAAEGVRFTQFYAPSPICSPSRAGLLTGRYPLRAGTPGNCDSKPGKPGMPTEQVTLAEVFQRAGYATAHVGKWHLGYTPDTMPNAQGFEHSFGHMGGCIDNYSHFFYWSGPNRHDLHRNGAEVFADGRHFQDLMLEEASAFLEAHRADPFFLYFALNAPHYPYQGEARWLAHYRERGVPYPRDLYAAFVSTLDEHIGELLAKVEELGLSQDTIVVFQSDQGHSVEERAHFGGGSAGIWRGAKFSLFEGGIRVPAIIRQPGHLPTGAVRGQIAHGCDWFPTLAELCSVPVGELVLDGRSLVEVLRSEEAPTPHDVLHWQVSGGGEVQWAVREGDWKLIGNPVDPTQDQPLAERDRLYLTNPVTDPSERHNLIDANPEIAARLEKLHDQWVREGG